MQQRFKGTTGDISCPPPCSLDHITSCLQRPTAASDLIRALLTSLSPTNCTKADGDDASEENVPRFTLRFQFHVLISDAPTNEVPEEDEEPVVPAGTRPHNAPSVLPGEWESTTVAMFVTSSYGHILHEAPASRGLAALLLKYLHLF